MGTGIIRCIDSLGRVVIPKEIRKNCKIKEGDPLEFSVTSEGIMMVPYIELKAKKDDIAREWLTNHQLDIKMFSAKFTIEGTKTICEVIRRNGRKVGESRCDPHDNYSPAIGMVIAFCRANSITIPKELLED